MRDFCMRLGRALHKPSWFPVPEFVLKLAGGELGSLMTTGQRVVPRKALHEGYVFQHATLESALQALFSETTVVGRVA
jgi:NAD dependent epimerase/dehydratase family enzyme